jgi:general stress protein 26
MVSGTGSYDEALKNISKVITVFANKNAFKLADIDAQLESPADKGKIEELWLDIQNISLDQSNNLW